MKETKRAKILYIGISSLMIILGLFLIIWPKVGVTTVCYMIGIFSLIFGIVKIIGYFTKDLYRLAFQFDFALGLFACIVGIIFIIHPWDIAKIFPVIIGVFMIIDGALKFQTAYDAKKFGLFKWWLVLIFAILTVLCGILLMINPFDGLVAVMIVLGISLIADGVQNLYTAIYMIKIAKNLKEKGTKIDEDTEFHQ